MTSDPVLVAERVVRGFGGVRAVDVEHLTVERGTITALIGPNGAGKTTLFNVLTGFDRADGGRWSFDGTDVTGLPAHRIARLGMVRTFQLTRVLGRLTVLENMLVGARHQPGETLRRALVPALWKGKRAADVDRARELLDRFALGAKAGDHAASLSGGQRKLLEMARALMNEPTLVMLDEPMAGVNPALARSLLDHITALRDEGRTVLFVEHDLHLVKSVSDRVVVMAQGAVVTEGAPDTVLRDPAVVDAYLGAHHDTDLREIIARETARETAGETAEETG
ncbi:ABC transporter ATP-binding protein [Actinophytocola xinjiangensis]|uniref:ABC transporter ATP-binding protein n=1 Tax=Actinophytocola xinjiangensis TaxID=485602 RepID=A0A7Z1AZQ6_9PSEU|nr:ABC transporter ATP-binding protein [Actinophytocola xinjiangensis]OLF12338.1 ABC transporter ATP-binding protein [Actinophytocola xinjiangensis]